MSRLMRIIRGEDRSLTAGVVRTFLSALSVGYRVVVRVRNAAFAIGWRRGARLPRPVLSVGNLTAGGTGKTPMVLELARRALARGRRPAILLRGYRAGSAGSDEARLLVAALGPDVPVRAHASRRVGSAAVIDVHPEVDLFLLDDGFQHRQVHRDVDLVLVDATDPWGGCHLLPRGLLREPPAALRRADAIVVTRADLVCPEELAELDGRIRARAGRPVLAHAVHRWVAWRDGAGGRHDLAALADQHVLGVCGIANPRPFQRALTAATARRPTFIAFDDHHAYRGTDLARIFEAAASEQARAVVTTDKDWIKWSNLLPDPAPVPVYRPELRIELLEGWDALDDLVDAKLVYAPPDQPRGRPAP